MVSYQTPVTHLSPTAGTWASIGLLEDVPASVNGVDVTQAQMSIAVDSAENSQVYVDDAVVYQFVVTSSDMKALVERLEDEGEIENDHTAHALKMHLTAVDRFERQEAAEKVVKHLHGFQLLLDHQRDNALISEQAHNSLSEDANSMTKRWENF